MNWFSRTAPTLADANEAVSWGQPGHLNEEQEAALKEMAAKIPHEKERTLLRFLRARKFDVEQSAEMYLKAVEFFKREQPARLRVKQMVPIVKRRQFLSCGFDRMGRPVLHILTHHHRLEDSDMGYKAMLFFVELCLQLLEEGNSYQTDSDQLTVIFHLGKFGMKNYDVNWCYKAFATMQSYYPERMGQCLLVDAGSVFSTLWAVIRPLMNQRTASKMNFISSAKGQIWDFVDVDQVPEELGGSLKFSIEEWIEGRHRLEDFQQYSTVSTYNINIQ